MNVNVNLPQNDIEAERKILGAMLLSEDGLVKAADLVSAEHFYAGKHQAIFNAILDCYQNDGAVDLTNLSARLKETEWYEKAGGISYLIEVLDSTATSANVGIHCKIIKNKSLLRRIEASAMELAQAGREEEDGKALLSKMEGRLIELSQMVVEKKKPDTAAILSEIHENWRKIASGESVCVPVNRKLLSDAVLGWYPGHMIVVGGYTSAGKSTWLAQTIVDACRSGASVMLFSLEDGRPDKMIKLISNVADISQRTLIQGVFTEYQKGLIGKAESEIRSWPLLVYDDVYSLEEIRLKVKKEKMRGMVDMVAIDYVQNIKAEGKIYDRMSYASDFIYKMGKELQVTTINLSQVNNESAKDDSDVIGLKGAGELAAAADLILWLKRMKGVGNERELDCEIRKSRAFGVTGTRYLQFSERWTRIEKSDARLNREDMTA